MKEHKEKRRFPRLPAYHLAKYAKSSGPGTAVKVIASVKDISGGGACIEVKEDLPLQAILQLYIQFPGTNGAIPCLAKVAWKKFIKSLNRYRVGVQFLEIDDISRRGISEHVNKVFSIVGKKKQ